MVEKKCNHCMVTEGHIRPIGSYIVELHSFEFMGEELELCITCYKHYRRKLELKTEEVRSEDKKGFYSSFKKFYREAFNLQQTDQY